MPGRSDNGSDAGETGTFQTYRDEGEHFVHVKQYDKAIDSFTKAMELNPEDLNCMISRAKCWLQCGNAENALIDAESALDKDDKYIRGLYVKAEALYQRGDFETALVFFHRGFKLRPELEEFRLGIQKAQEAITNSIGSPDSVKLEATGDLSYFYKQEESKKAQQKGTYSKPGAKKEAKKERERPKSAADTKTIKQLLGELYGDKEYLEKLLKDDSLTAGQTYMAREIKDNICDGLEYLNSRADFWRQQKPMYARKRDRERVRRGFKSRSHDPTSYILKCLEDIDDAQTDGKYEESLNKAKKTLKYVENMSDDDIQNKQEILANLHSQIGNAYLEMGKFHQSLDHHNIDLRIARENDLEDARSRALDNMGRVHARKGDFDKAVEVWEEKLPLSKSPLESTWLYHEIGRCYLELGKYSDARDYGEKSLAAAKEAEDEGWQLHASVLVAQSEVKVGDLQAAAESFERSLEMAKKLNDGPAENAIKKALEEVNDKIVRGVKDGDEQEDDRGSNRSREVESRGSDFVHGERSYHELCLDRSLSSMLEYLADDHQKPEQQNLSTFLTDSVRVDAEPVQKPEDIQKESETVDPQMKEKIVHEAELVNDAHDGAGLESEKRSETLPDPRLNLNMSQGQGHQESINENLSDKTKDGSETLPVPKSNLDMSQGHAESMNENQSGETENRPEIKLVPGSNLNMSQGQGESKNESLSDKTVVAKMETPNEIKDENLVIKKNSQQSEKSQDSRPESQVSRSKSQDSRSRSFESKTSPVQYIETPDETVYTQPATNSTNKNDADNEESHKKRKDSRKVSRHSLSGKRKISGGGSSKSPYGVLEKQESKSSGQKSPYGRKKSKGSNSSRQSGNDSHDNQGKQSQLSKYSENSSSQSDINRVQSNQGKESTENIPQSFKQKSDLSSKSDTQQLKSEEAAQSVQSDNSRHGRSVSVQSDKSRHDRSVSVQSQKNSQNQSNDTDTDRPTSNKSNSVEISKNKKDSLNELNINESQPSGHSGNVTREKSVLSDELNESGDGPRSKSNQSKTSKQFSDSDSAARTKSRQSAVSRPATRAKSSQSNQSNLSDGMSRVKSSQSAKSNLADEIARAKSSQSKQSNLSRVKSSQSAKSNLSDEIARAKSSQTKHSNLSRVKSSQSAKSNLSDEIARAKSSQSKKSSIPDGFSRAKSSQSSKRSVGKMSAKSIKQDEQSKQSPNAKESKSQEVKTSSESGNVSRAEPNQSKNTNSNAVTEDSKYSSQSHDIKGALSTDSQRKISAESDGRSSAKSYKITQWKRDSVKLGSDVELEDIIKSHGDLKQDDVQISEDLGNSAVKSRASIASGAPLRSATVSPTKRSGRETREEVSAKGGREASASVKGSKGEGASARGSAKGSQGGASVKGSTGKESQNKVVVEQEGVKDQEGGAAEEERPKSSTSETAEGTKGTKQQDED